MFEVGSIVYFKNPNHFGDIENTDIGYRWCSEKGCDELHTAPLFTATAGIIKSKFEVVAVHGDSESGSVLVEVRSVDKHDLKALVVPEFLVTNANTSSIPNAVEKRLLLYLHALSECAAPVAQPNKVVKEEVTDNPQDKVKTHDCANCGKCSNKQPGHRNTKKDLKDLADQWEKLFSGGNRHCEKALDEEPETAGADIDGLTDELIDTLVDSVYSEVMRRLEAKKAEEKLKSFRNPYEEYGPYFWGGAIPAKRPVVREVPKTLDELIREFFG